ncbi:MAG: peptidoglycan bridge formation glycyltransferase FemA/FemB family protein [Armatimonadetes bacterium]|nr:peptidoglycan bridge formation glycyltransferase FemA/FemB family protein [Armatimonadota bacterium]
MRMREIEESEKDRFNRFIAEFPTGDLMQSYEWGEVKSQSGGWSPVRVVGEDESGRIVAAAGMLIRRIPRTGRSVAYIPRGPVLDTTDATAVMSFTEGLRRSASARGAILVKIDPPVPVEDETSRNNIERAGFRPISDPTGFGGTQPKCVMQLDLGPDLDELIAGFKPKTRYNIRLAEKKGVYIKTECAREDLPVFYELLRVTAKRDGFLVRGYSYYETLWDVLVNSGCARLFMSYYGETPLGGALAFIIGDRAWYVYGASSNEHRNLMPNYLMQWEMIKWARAAGCKWYDFRGVSPRRGASEKEDHLQGLNRFKEGFSARYVEYIGEYDLPLSPFWYWLWVRAKPAAMSIIKSRARSKVQTEL